MPVNGKWVTVLLVCAGIASLGGCGVSPTSPGRERLVYVAMGASDAVGIGALPLTDGYVYRIRNELRAYADSVDFYNLGVSGKRMAYIEETELPFALEQSPDVVTLWPGPNDMVAGLSVEDFEASLQRVIQQIREATPAILVLANVPDLTQVPRFLIDPDADVTLQRVNAYNVAIARQAAAYQVPVVDLFGGGYADEWEYVSVDGFHPSNAGHAKIAELFLQRIVPYL